MPNALVENDRPLVRSFVGWETVPGTAVAATAKWYADCRLAKSQNLANRPSYNGTFFGDSEIVRGGIEVAGNFSAVCTYEDWIAYLRLLVKGGGTGSTDGGSPPAYTYTKKPTGTTNDLDSASMYYGFPDMPKLASMFWFTQGTIRAAIDDEAACWMFDSPGAIARQLDFVGSQEGTATSATATTIVDTALSMGTTQYVGGMVWVVSGTGKGQVRDVISHTATALTVAAWDTNPVSGDRFIVLAPFATGGPADRTRETIDGPGTLIYVDRKSGGTIGTTQIDNYAIPLGFEISYNNNGYGKRGLSNTTTMTTKRGRGLVQVRGSIQVEDENPYFEQEWKNNRPQLIRIRQSGAIIHDAVRSRATIDVYNAVFDTPTESDRQSNVTRAWPFWGYLDATQAAPIQYEAVNALATLP